MDKQTRDGWKIGIMGGLLTGIPLMIASVYMGAWVTDTPIKHPLSLGWFFVVWNMRVPMWFVACLVLTTSIAVARIVSERSARKQLTQRFEQLQTEFKSESEKNRRHYPTVHGVWNNAQTFWAMGNKGNEPIMQIGGWINLTSTNTTANIFILNAYINGQRSDMFIPVEVKPNVVNEEMLMLFMLPPLTKDLNEPFRATVVLEDQYNRKFEMPEHTFRATNRTAALPNTPTAPNLGPKLHASWLGSSDWGWASTNFTDEGMRVYLIRGEVTLLLANATEPVHIVGAEIEGAKSMGDFETFDLHPDHPRKHEMKLYFRGPAPKGIDNYAPQITFVDIKGNRYPTEPHTFHPFPVIDRVNVERHGRL